MLSPEFFMFYDYGWRLGGMMMMLLLVVHSNICLEWCLSIKLNCQHIHISPWQANVQLGRDEETGMQEKDLFTAAEKDRQEMQKYAIYTFETWWNILCDQMDDKKGPEDARGQFSQFIGF